MNKWQAWLLGMLLLLPSLTLGAVGIIELQDGYAIDRAFPVPDFLSNNTLMSKAAYADAMQLLRGSIRRNGDAQIVLAASMFRAGARSSQTLTVIENGLMGAPASSEGWVYYTTILASSQEERAGQSLNQAFTLAPYDYFFAGTRARLGAQLWPVLDEVTRVEVLRQARELWEAPLLRPQLLPLLATADGARLLSRAYSEAPQTIRDINRWVVEEQRKPRIQGS